jgi:membrane dipeptidase
MHSFDGHNDVLLRLWRQDNDSVAAFLEGESRGQLDLPRAQAGGLIGGLYAIFVPSESKQSTTAPVDSVPYDIPVPAPPEMTHAQLATVEMASLLLRIAQRSDGRVRIARSVAGRPAADWIASGIIAPSKSEPRATPSCGLPQELMGLFRSRALAVARPNTSSAAI